MSVVILSDGLVGSRSGSVSAYGDACYACYTWYACYACASGKALYHAGDESDDYWCVPAHAGDVSNAADAGWHDLLHAGDRSGVAFVG